MASGTLASSNPAATTNTVVYTVPTGKIASFNVNIANTSGVTMSVRLAVAATGTPTLNEYFEYDLVIPGNSSFERSGILASAGKNIVAYVSNENAAINIFGYEE